MKFSSLVTVAALFLGVGAALSRANSPATVSHSAPSTVYVGQSFTVSATCNDVDGNLSGMCVRWQNYGMQAYWALSGYSGSRSTTLTAPSTPCTMTIRADAIDLLDAGGVSPWQTISVIDYPPTVNHPPSIGLGFSSPTAATGVGFTVTANASDPDGSVASFDLDVMGIRWQDRGLAGFWNGLSGGSASRSVALTAPSVPGTQYFRGEVWDDADAGVAADWQAFVVVAASNPSVAVTPVSPKLGQSISVAYAYAPNTVTWIGLFPTGASNSAYLASAYVPSAGSGSVTFSIGSNFQEGQTYEARMFPSNGNTPSATSNSFTVSAANPTYTLTVQGGTGAASGLHSGDIVTITATPGSGHTFIRWSMYGSGNGLIGNALSPTTTFTVGSTDAIVQVIYDVPLSYYMLNVIGGTRLPAGPLESGGLTNLTATPGPGDTFLNWTRLNGAGTFGNAAQPSTTFTIGAQDTTVQANYLAGIRLALQYWQGGDYPNFQGGHYEDVSYDGYWQVEITGIDVDAFIANGENWTWVDVYDPDGNYYSAYPAEWYLDWQWYGPYSGTEWVDEIFPDGQYGPSWSTNAGIYNIADGASAYTPANANRGTLSNTYSAGQQITFRAWGQAPNNNCNSYLAVLRNPSGAIIQSGSFASGSYSQGQFTPSSNGVYRVDISYSNATGNANPTSATVSYFIPVGSLTAQTITFPTIPNHLATDAPIAFAALGATASSGLPVSYSVLSGPATINSTNNTLTLTGLGTVTIRASQGGSATYNVAPNVDRSFTVNSVPTITTQPANVSATPGATTIFSVVATGNGLGYQWRKNGVALANSNIVGGATTASLVLVNVQAANIASYDVVVTNSAGSVTSTVATLTLSGTGIDLHVHRP